MMRFVEVRDFDNFPLNHVPANLCGGREIPQIVHLESQPDQVRISGADLRGELNGQASPLRDRRLCGAARR
jgi:hypothetical protein